MLRAESSLNTFLKIDGDGYKIKNWQNIYFEIYLQEIVAYVTWKDTK